MKVLFTYSKMSGFVKNDIDLLSSMYEIKTVQIKPSIKPFIEMFKGILWADYTYSWFANIGALWCVIWSKLFRKKSIVVIGGYEVAKIPEIRYGAMLDKNESRKVKFILNHADELICVSDYNKKETQQYTDNPLKLIYNCVDTDYFKPHGDKEDIVLMVASADAKIRKGIHTYIEVAKQMPDIQFVMVGSNDFDKNDIPSNLKLPGHISDQELLEYYQRAKVYCQLSYYESFGVAILEAMACNCIPVVTHVAAIPEVVGLTGYYVEYGNVEDTVNAIKQVLNNPVPNYPRSPREQALFFDISDRKHGLEQLF